MNITPQHPILLLSDVNANREAWHELRKGKVSATKIGVIMGLNKWKSPLQLWAEETGKVVDTFEGNDQTRLGLFLEPFVAELLQNHLGGDCHVQLANALYQHPKYDYAIASPDAFVVYHDHLELAELKTANSRALNDWLDGNAPEAYQVQLQWQMGVLGIHSGYLAGLIGGDTSYFPHPFYEFDNELWEIMLDQAVDFLDCIQRDVPPEPGPGDAKLIERIVDRNKSVRMLPEAERIEAETLVPMLLAARNQKSEINEILKEKDDQVKTLENKLRLLLGNSTAASAAGYVFEVQTVNVSERHQAAYQYTKLKLAKRK